MVRNDGKPPLTYHQFQNTVAGMDSPNPPVSTITSSCIGDAYTPIKTDHDDVYGVPTLEELGKTFVNNSDKENFKIYS